MSLHLVGVWSNVGFTCERGWPVPCASMKRDRGICQAQALSGSCHQSSYTCEQEVQSEAR